MNLLLLRLRLIPARAVWLVVLVATLSGFVSVGVTYRALRRPPTVLLTFKEDDGVARVGGDLSLRATKRTNEICRTRVARWLWHWAADDSRPDPGDTDPMAFAKKRSVWRELHSAPDAPPIFTASAEYELLVPILPEDHIEPGDWRYLGEASDDCGATPRFSLPLAPIHIEAATAAIMVPGEAHP